MSTLVSLQRRLDREALDQLREEVARLAAVNERLTEELGEMSSALYHAMKDADTWWELAQSMQQELAQSGSAARPAISQNGELFLVRITP